MAFGHEKLDVYRAAITPEENEKAKALLDRIVAMLTKLGQRGYAVCEEPGEYRTEEIDPDTDTDPDPERSKTGNRQPPAGCYGIPRLTAVGGAWQGTGLNGASLVLNTVAGV